MRIRTWGKVLLETGIYHIVPKHFTCAHVQRNQVGTFHEQFYKPHSFTVSNNDVAAHCEPQTACTNHVHHVDLGSGALEHSNELSFTPLTPHKTAEWTELPLHENCITHPAHCCLHCVFHPQPSTNCPPLKATVSTYIAIYTLKKTFPSFLLCTKVSMLTWFSFPAQNYTHHLHC